jgi:hypothetical protein
MSDIVNLDVGGVHYSVARSTIMKYEDTMLAKLVSEKWSPKSSEAPIFVDRDGERFKYILDFFRDGEIFVPNTVPIDSVRKDAVFFGLPEDASIIVAKNTLSLKDLNILWSTVKEMQEESKMQQLYDGAAFYAIEQLLKVETPNISGKDISVRMTNYGSIGGIMETKENRLKLVATIKNLILSFEKVVLTPSSVSVGSKDKCVIFTIKL